MIQYYSFNGVSFSAGPTRKGNVVIDLHDQEGGGCISMRLSPEHARLIIREIEGAVAIAEIHTKQALNKEPTP
jgi:hypothetical protein